MVRTSALFIAAAMVSLTASASGFEDSPAWRLVAQLDGLAAQCKGEGYALRYNEAPMTTSERNNAVQSLVECPNNAVRSQKEGGYYEAAIGVIADSAMKSLVRRYYVAWLTRMERGDFLMDEGPEAMAATLELDLARTELRVELAAP